MAFHWWKSIAVVLLLLGDQTTGKVQVPEKIDDCRGKAADVVFVMDASNSIWEVDFKRQLSFVNEVVDQFHIGRRYQRVSVVTYSDHPQLQFPFFAYDLKSDLKAAVSSIRQMGGHDTMTDEALAYLRQYSFTEEQGARLTYWVNKIGIVVTDGDSRNATATMIQAQLARESGIHLFAIGVGSNVRNEELEMIASKPTEYYTFRVNDFKSMDTIKNFLAIKTCAATNPPTTRRTTTTTTTTTTSKPTTTSTTTTTTTTTTKAPTTTGKSTTPKNSIVHYDPLVPPKSRGTSSTRLGTDANSRDVSHTMKLGHGVDHEPPSNIRHLSDEGTPPKRAHEAGLPPIDRNGSGASEGDEFAGNSIEGRAGNDQEGEGSGHVVDLLHLDRIRHGGSNGNDWQESNVQAKNPDDWNIVTDEHSGSDTQVYGNNDNNNNNLFEEEEETDPYGHLLTQAMDVNPDRTPRRDDCDDVDFWGTDDDNKVVYYRVAKAGHRQGHFYHVVMVDGAPGPLRLRNSRRDFWGYDDRGRAIGMRFYEPRSDASFEDDQRVAWPGPAYEMLSGPCLPTPPPRHHPHHNNPDQQHQQHQRENKDHLINSNSIMIKVIEDDGSAEEANEDETSVDNHLRNGGKVVFQDKHGLTGFWHGSSHSGQQVWYQFVCPGVYVEADNATGLPLHPSNIPSRINLPPPPHGDAQRGCWTRKKMRGHNTGSEEENGGGRGGSNDPEHEFNKVFHHVSSNNNNNKDNDDDDHELVWVEYTAPGRFDPADRKPEVRFEKVGGPRREGHIPEDDNSISDSSFHSHKFSGKPKLWGVQRNGSLECMMTEASTKKTSDQQQQRPQQQQHHKHKQQQQEEDHRHAGHHHTNEDTPTNDLDDSGLPPFRPETITIRDGEIFAELSNGSRSPIGCMIGATHMIGRWINRKAALAIIKSDQSRTHDQETRFFFGYPVEANHFVELNNNNNNKNKENNKISSNNNGQNFKTSTNDVWKPSIPLKLKICQPALPLDVVVGVDVRSRSTKRRRRTWQIVKDFVSGLDMRRKKVSVRFAHDFTDQASRHPDHQLDAASGTSHHHHGHQRHDQRVKRWSEVYTEKSDLIGKIDAMESSCGTSSLLRTMADMLGLDGFELSRLESSDDRCNETSSSSSSSFSSSTSSASAQSGKDFQPKAKVRKIAILFVDGSIEDMRESLELVEETRRRMDFELFVVGVGRAAEPEQLMSLASNNGLAVDFFSFDSNRHDPRYLEQLELFFLHKDPRMRQEAPPVLGKARHSSKPQYRHEITKLLTRLCENR